MSVSYTLFLALLLLAPGHLRHRASTIPRGHAGAPHLQPIW